MAEKNNNLELTNSQTIGKKRHTNKSKHRIMNNCGMASNDVWRRRLDPKKCAKKGRLSQQKCGSTLQTYSEN